MKSILLTIVPAAAAALLVALNLQADEPSTPAKATRHTQTIVLGSGCFWGAEKGYEALPGVIDAVSGYADGRGLEPTYKAITRPEHRMDPDNFAEVVKVTYDTGKTSTEALLKHFFEHHDPTQANRQGNDIGTQYRSIILTANDEQAEAARRLQAQYQVLLSEAGYGEIKTVIKPLEQFHAAETYHQDYLAKNPNGYCPGSFNRGDFCQGRRARRGQQRAHERPADSRSGSGVLPLLQGVPQGRGRCLSRRHPDEFPHGQWPQWA